MFKTAGNIECGDYRIVETAMADDLHFECQRACVYDSQCGGYLWNPTSEHQRCRLVNHEEIAIKCTYSERAVPDLLEVRGKEKEKTITSS